MDDLASRLANRVQLTTDGHRVYLQAVEDAFGRDVDYAMLIKLYGEDRKTEARIAQRSAFGASSKPYGPSESHSTFRLATSSART